MESTENHPSLINCLDKRTGGIFIDLMPSDVQSGHPQPNFHTAPYSKIVRADIKTDGNALLQRMLLILQRDDYDISDGLVPVTNRHIEAAWQHAAGFHQRNGSDTPPVFFRNQFDPAGALQPHRPLFRCTHTDRWFHPVCPQCGLPLTLCRDDGLLEKMGVPTYSASHERFLYCRSCAVLSGSALLYVHQKQTEMPDFVFDKSHLIAQWKQLVDKLPTGNGLPCEGCSEIDACWQTGSEADKRIDCFSFYPFFMLMAAAPSCSADQFIGLLSGDPASVPLGDGKPLSETGRCGFFFEGQERLFLEILYLKLTFLSQLCQSYLTGDGPEMDLALEGIGVDMAPSDTGLPALWQFRTRLLNLIGSNQPSPFAPMVPVAPRLHFLGAVWMRTMLVNSVQGADTVFPEIARIIDAWPAEQEWMSLPIDISDPNGPLAGSQIFWTPDSRVLPPEWQAYWVKALRLGLYLVQAGLKAGQDWDASTFFSTLDDLREAVKQDLFADSMAAPTEKPAADLPTDLKAALGGILDKWKTQATLIESQHAKPDIPDPGGDDTRHDVQQGLDLEPRLPPPAMAQDNSMSSVPTDTVTAAPATSEQEQDLGGSADNWQDPQQTIVLSEAVPSPSAAAPPDKDSGTTLPEAPWDDDTDQTIVLQPDGSLPGAKEPAGNMDATIVTASASISAGSGLANEDDDLAATMIQNSSPADRNQPDAASDFSDPGGFEDDMEATVVINTAAPPAGPPTPPPSDDDLAATLVQGSHPNRSALPSQPPPTGPQPGDAPEPEEDLEATVMINPTNRMPPPPIVNDLPGTSDDDLAATLIETPGRPLQSDNGKSWSQTAGPPPPSPPPQGVSPPPNPNDAGNPNDGFDTDEDDVMEQTVIIRSTIKKE